MKIILAAINAKYIHSNLAIYSLKAHAKRANSEVELAEYTINNRLDSILEDLYRRAPEVLCLSVYIWNVEYMQDLIGEFHKICPEVPIWVGGPEVSYRAEEFIRKNPAVTGVMRGEGEETFREFCECYLDGSRALSEIAGITYREGEQILANPDRMILDMSTIPFAYDESIDVTNRIVYYESSRGCPFSCSYCLSSVDKKLRFRDIELVKKELQYFLDKRVPQVKFVDRTFNCKHEHAMAIWSFIKAQDNGVTNFHFEVSADLLQEEELELISTMRPGLIQLEIGVQSTNDVTIKEIHRTMKLERLKEIVCKIQSFGNIHQHLDLIAGLPFEGYESFANSFDEVYALKPNQLQLGFLKVLTGSYMYEHANEYGILYHDKAPYEVLSTNWLSYGEVLRIKQVEEMVETYYNSGQFEVTMKILECFYESAFVMYQKLGEFFWKSGYHAMSHTRNRRAEILLEFARDEGLGEEKMLEEAVLFDLYYRENCKSRPKWAPDVAAFKHMTRFYCKKGTMHHVEPFHYRFPQKEERTVMGLPERLEKPVWALFSYEERDVLDHQARVTYVSEEDVWQQEEQKKS